MKSVLKFIQLLFLIFILFVEQTFSKVMRRYFFTGTLSDSSIHEGNSRIIDYADTDKDEWKNLTALGIKYGLKAKTMFCSEGEGMWITYPLESFNHGSLYYTLVLGDYCINADNTNSLQPLGFTYGRQHSWIAYFKETYFASSASVIYNGTVSGDFKSLIYAGDEPWTLEGQGKKGAVKFCLVRELIERVCILPDLASQLGLTSTKITLTRGCLDRKSPHYYMQTCFTLGIYTVAHSFNFEKPTMTELCKGGSKPDSKIASKFTSLMEIWNARINQDVEQFGQINMNMPEAQRKVDFLMEFVDVFAQGCPSSSPHYLSLLGNVFLMHLRRVWKANPKLVTKSDVPWLESYDFLQHCGMSLHDGVPHDDGSTGCEITPPESASNIFETEAMEIMVQGDTFDVVIEQIWLILNYIAPFCNHLDGYSNNQWTDFPTLFKKTFLFPLEKQWINPGYWQQLYPILFNGYDITYEHKSIIICVQAGLRLTPLLDPVGRTKGFENLFWTRFGHGNTTDGGGGGGDSGGDSSGGGGGSDTDAGAASKDGSDDKTKDEKKDKKATIPAGRMSFKNKNADNVKIPGNRRKKFQKKGRMIDGGVKGKKKGVKIIDGKVSPINSKGRSLSLKSKTKAPLTILPIFVNKTNV